MPGFESSLGQFTFFFTANSFFLEFRQKQRLTLISVCLALYFRLNMPLGKTVGVVQLRTVLLVNSVLAILKGSTLPA